MPSGQTYAWTDWEKETLLTLWKQGLSARQVAEQLGTGRSRNAVIGLVHRMGLPRRTGECRPVRTRRAKRLTDAQRVMFKKPPARQAPPQERTPAAMAAILALPPIDPTLDVLRLNAFTCRFPIGDPDRPGFTFCGRTCDPEAPYCTQHARLTYRPGKPPEPRHAERVRPEWREGWGVAA